MEFPKKETLNGKCFNSGWFSKGLFKTFLMSKDGRQKWTWITSFF